MTDMPSGGVPIRAVGSRIAVIGGGILGARSTRELLAPTAGVVVVTRRLDRVGVLHGTFGSSVTVLSATHTTPDLGPGVSTVVLARAAGEQVTDAREQLRLGRNVVATSDDPDEVEAMLA